MPNIGHLSGVVGRNPAQLSSIGNSPKDGIKRVASERQCIIPDGVMSPSNLPGSTVAPTIIRPSAFGTMYVSCANNTRDSIGGAFVGIRNEKD